MANLGVVGSPTAPKEMTLTERLNVAAKQIDSACNRLESTLSRVNSAPGSTSEKDSPGNLGLADLAGRYETISQRISMLADGVERIA